MPESTELEQLLDAAEDVTRSASIRLGKLKAYFISDDLMQSLKNAVAKYRPVPYCLQGGKKVRAALISKKQRAGHRRR